MSVGLNEVAEATVHGRTAAIYEEIRDAVDAPMVNLIYRYLASVPAYFEPAWAQVRPNLRSQQAHAAGARLREAARLDGATTIPASALPLVGIDAETLTRIHTTLRVYNQANPMNLQAVTALLSAIDGEPLARGNEQAAAEPIANTDRRRATLVRMAALDEANPATLRLLADMGRPLTGVQPDEPSTGIVPSLLRHFIPWPGLLALLWTVLRPLLESEQFAERRRQLAEQARREVAAWPYPVVFSAGDVRNRGVDADTLAKLRAVLARFTTVIPSMIIAGVALAQALPDTLDDR